MKKRLGGVMQTAMAILLCMAAVLCVTRLQTGHAPREDARAAHIGAHAFHASKLRYQACNRIDKQT